MMTTPSGTKVDTSCKDTSRPVLMLSTYGVQLLIASVICSAGFLTNSETVVIGSMLISPIGAVLLDVNNPSTGGRIDSMMPWLKLLMSVVVCTFVGFLAGLVTPVPDQSSAKGRGYDIARNRWLLFSGAVVAMMAGFIFRWSNINLNVGIGIATALLPPLVAIGYYGGRMAQKDKTYTATDRNFAFVSFIVNALLLVCISYGSDMLLKAMNLCKFDFSRPYKESAHVGASPEQVKVEIS